MLAQALGDISMNNGALRGTIWKYFMEKYKDHVDYQTFVIAMMQLVKTGKVEKNENGYFWIQREVYNELYALHKKGRTSSQAEEKASNGSVDPFSNKKSAGRLSTSNLAKKMIGVSSRTYGPSTDPTKF